MTERPTPSTNSVGCGDGAGPPADPDPSGLRILRGVRLTDWQIEAGDAWERGDTEGSHRGTLEIFTGGGKSLIALECLRRAALAHPDIRAAIVVPTIALARQWRKVVLTHTSLTADQVGWLYGERKDGLQDKRVIIAVLNSAAEHLPGLADQITDPLFLIVDECHRAGAPRFSRVLETSAEYRLGLSATAEREDVDDDGQTIDYDDHVLGRGIGGIVYRFDLRAAREVGWLPEFVVYHHGIGLGPEEQQKYEELSRRVDDLSDRLSDLGIDAGSARRASSRPGEEGTVARAYVAAVSLRKDLLYRATERSRVVEILMRELTSRSAAPRVLLFHERIDEAIALHELLSGSLPVTCALEHSRLPESRRREALESFASGVSPVLVSVKALVEGIDVPDADVGMSVASSSSVRQRVQALGRVLRRRFDGATKKAEMHVFYVSETVDEAIYAKEDWSDLTGASSNTYLGWPYDGASPTRQEGPPRTPKPTEDQFLESLGGRVPDDPVEWLPMWPTQEWRLDGRGSITDLSGRLVTNPQGSVEAIRRIRPGGGRFRVSSRHRLIVVPDPGRDSGRALLVGRLDEPFHMLDESGAGPSPSRNEPGQTQDSQGATTDPPSPPDGRFTGPTDRLGGTYRLRQKSGGLIERRTRRGREFAGSADGEGLPELVSNANRVLEAWRRTGEAGLTFYINGLGDAFYTSGGEMRFLARVPGGFAWPTEAAQDTDTTEGAP